jgi:outer membrane lipoprotein-sorting protein
MWPDANGKNPPLEESYTYRNLQINTGLTANDFDPKNPAIFK